jgi:hypothetical protein
MPSNKHPVTECIELNLQRYLDDLKGTLWHMPNKINPLLLPI